MTALNRTRSTLANQIVVSKQVLDETHAFLNARGLESKEGLVLWAGERTKDRIVARQCLFPEQASDFHGCNLRVDGDEMARINRLLAESESSLVAQIHTHPGEAFHSQTDDLFPAVHHRGALSLVVPFFAQMTREAFIRFEAFSAHVLEEWPMWCEIPIGKMADRVEIEG